MTEKNNATCSICGRPYHMCLSCRDTMKLYPWKMHTDTSEHYKIYQILHGYSTGVYNKKEAKSKLKKVDLSDFDSLRDNIKNLINIIMAEPKTTEKSVVDSVVENKVNVETEVVVKVESSVEVEEEPKMVYKKKSSKIVEAD